MAPVFCEHWERRHMTNQAGAPSQRHATKAAFFGETQTAYVCSTEPYRAVEDGVEDGLQVPWRARNGVEHFRYGRLLLDEFGHPILRLRDSPFSGDTLVHAEQLLGSVRPSITAQAAVRDSSHRRPNRRCGQTTKVWSGRFLALSVTV